MEKVKYKIEAMRITSTQKYPAGGCNAIVFVNIGTVAFTVSQIPVPVGGSWGQGGNQNEADCTEYSIDFGSALNGICLIIKKINL